MTKQGVVSLNVVSQAAKQCNYKSAICANFRESH